MNMVTQRALLGFLSLLMFTVQTCQSVCVDPNAHAENNTVETEAVLGNALKLVCISCLKREEIEAETKVKWYYITDKNQPYKLIFLYDKKPQNMEGQWEDRLEWNGSKDLQDVSISITNVTMNDTGKYMCVVERTFTFNLYTPTFSSKMMHKLVVRPKASLDYTALYSEIMMYVLLVFLTLWLLVEMIYCYRKISKSDEQAQDSATDYLAIPSENKENPGPAVTE